MKICMQSGCANFTDGTSSYCGLHRGAAATAGVLARRVGVPLEQNETEKPASVVIKFKSSSQPKGQDGFELAVSSDATEADVDRTMLLAARAREQAQAVLAGEYTGTGQVEAQRGRCPYCYRDSNMHTMAEWEACRALEALLTC